MYRICIYDSDVIWNIVKVTVMLCEICAAKHISCDMKQAAMSKATHKIFTSTAKKEQDSNRYILSFSHSLEIAGGCRASRDASDWLRIEETCGDLVVKDVFIF